MHPARKETLEFGSLRPEQDGTAKIKGIVQTINTGDDAAILEAHKKVVTAMMDLLQSDKDMASAYESVIVDVIATAHGTSDITQRTLSTKHAAVHFWVACSFTATFFPKKKTHAKEQAVE